MRKQALSLTLLAVLASVCVPVNASIIYRMVGGTCTDSNHAQVFYPDIIEPGVGEFGPGPKLCANRVIAELRMSDTYVPGTSFSQTDHPESFKFAESIYVSDGVYSILADFSPEGFLGRVSGAMPVHAGKGRLDVSWFDGWYFTAYAEGGWEFWVEYGADRFFGECGIGSVEGPRGHGGICTPIGSAGHYVSIGRYGAWVRVPEPATIALVGAALFGVAATRRRQRLRPDAVH